jgi:hypothetical protein
MLFVFVFLQKLCGKRVQNDRGQRPFATEKWIAVLRWSFSNAHTPFA